MPQEEPPAGPLAARGEKTAREEAAREAARGEAARGEAAREETLRDAAACEEAVRLRVGQRMRELSQRLDQPSFALLLKVLGGVNAAFAQRGGRGGPGGQAEIDLTEEERALYTPALQGEVVTLLELACFPRRSVHTDAHPAPQHGAP